MGIIICSLITIVIFVVIVCYFKKRKSGGAITETVIDLSRDENSESVQVKAVSSKKKISSGEDAGIGINDSVMDESEDLEEKPKKNKKK